MAVYVCGSNKIGQLGLGTFEDNLEPVVIESLKGKRIVKVSAGEQHSLVLTEFGDLFCWGRGREGQLGQGDRKNLESPQFVTALKHERIVKADCGSYHTIVVSDTGKCYVFGKMNKFNEDTEKNYFSGFSFRAPEEKMKRMIEGSMQTYLAGDFVGEDELKSNNFGNFVAYMQTVPLLIEPLLSKKIVEVAAGYSFSIAITDLGRVYSWGFNEKGQLGHGHRFNQEFPKLIEELEEENIIKADCGQEHTLLLSDKGEVFSFGLGVFGQLGHGDLFDRLIPKKVQFLVENKQFIIEISCGSYYTCARTVEGKVFSWGHSEYSQLGGSEQYNDWGAGNSVNSTERKQYNSTPRPLHGFNGIPIKHISCGHLHTVVVTQNDEVYSFGWGPSGCLGHGDRRFQLVPKQIEAIKGEPIAITACGWKHTLIVKEGSNNTFAFDFKGMVDNKMYSDITFEVEGKKIYAHKSIVFPRCPRIAKMLLFQNRFVSPNIDSVKINGVRYLVFMAFLRYLYTDHLKVAPHMIAELERFASKYSVPRLEEMCKRGKGNMKISIPPSQFASDLVQMVMNNLYSDITFIVQKQKIWSHRSLLVKRSSYFERLFHSQFKERDLNEFQIDESISPNIFISILRYLYTGDESIINPENAVDLLHAADRFMMDDLKNVVEAYIESSTDIETTCVLLDISDRVSAYRLKRVCLEIIGSSKESWEIVRSSQIFWDLKLSSPHLIREIDYKLSKNNIVKPGEVIRSNPFLITEKIYPTSIIV